MAIDSSLFVHESDRAAMQALKAIPGFSQLMKAYMSIWNERQFHIINMSSNLRISEKQMKKYYDMLPPICKKLGIEIPELYLELNVVPNSYTYGDTKPFIVVTSGLFETLPEELIPTVLAHECGHIACRHTMFTTMGRFILSGAARAPGLASLVTIPLQLAFAYWMRCSEFSADRVAMLCDGSSDKMIEVCMRFAGYDKDVAAEANVEAFMEQAVEYRELVKDSTWNKMLEFMMFNQISHPLNAVRAYECREWANGPQYERLVRYLADDRGEIPERKELPVPDSAKGYIGRNYLDVNPLLREAGFVNIQAVKRSEKGRMTKQGQILAISINGNDTFEKGDWFPADADINIVYYDVETIEEAAAARKGKVQIPDSSKKYTGRKFQDVMMEIRAAGFQNIIVERREVKKGIFVKNNSIIEISIDGECQFEKGAWFSPAADVRIVYSSILAEE